MKCLSFIRILILCYIIITPEMLWAQRPDRKHTTIAFDTAIIKKELIAASKLKSSFPDSALLLLQEIYTRSTLHQFYYGAILSLVESANIHTQGGRYKTAMDLLLKAQQQCTSERHPELLPAVYNNLGNVHNYLSRYDSAIHYYIKALDYKNKYQSATPDKYPPKGYIYNNIATCFSEQQNWPQARIYIDKTNAYAIQHGDSALLATSCNNLGNYYLINKNWDSCAIQYKKTIAIASRIGHKRILFLTYTGLGSLFNRTMQLDSALYYSLRAYDLFKEEHLDMNGNAVLLGNISDTYRKKKQYALARQFMDYALKVSNKTPREKSVLLAKEAALYADLKQFDKAYQLNEEYHKLNDSLNSTDVAVKISDLESRFELEQSRRALLQSNVLLREQQFKTQQRNFWLWFISACVLSGIITAWLWFRFHQKRQVTESEIAALKAKISGEEQERSRIAHDLHDGVNSQLTAVKSFLIVAENEIPDISSLHAFISAKNILSVAASDVRNIAHNLAPDNLVQAGLINAVAAYCAQQFGPEGIQFHLNESGNFDSLDRELSLNTYRIIQELCNNIVKHAAADTVTLFLTLQERQLDIIVEDNGKGLAVHTLREAKGLGIKSLRERVKMFDGELEIESEPGHHTTFAISFPLP